MNPGQQISTDRHSSSEKQGSAQKPSWLLILALGIGALAAGAASSWGRLILDSPIGSSMVNFHYPSTVAAGPDGTMIVADSGSRRLVGLSPEGKLRFIVRGESRSGGFYSGEALGFSADGGFYAANSVYSLQSVTTISQSFLLFSKDGRVKKSLALKNYSAEEQDSGEIAMIYSQARSNYLAWFYPDSDGVFALHVQRLDGGAELQARRFEGLDVYNMVDAAYASPDEVYLLERSGRILRRMGDSPAETWFSNEGKDILRFPVSMASGPDGSMYVLDAKSVVYRISAGETSEPVIERVFDSGICLKAGYAAPLSLASIFIGPDGSIYAPNENSGEILRMGKDGSLKAISGAKIDGGYQFLRWAIFLGWIITALAAAATIVLFYVKVIGRKSRLILRQLAILLPLTALVVSAITLYVYQDMRASLERELKHRLQHLSQQLSGSLPVSPLEALDLEKGRLENILASPEYAELSAVFDSIVNKNLDEWNSGVYPYVYVRRGGEWYIVGGFDYIERYPYAKAEFVKVLESGESSYYEYSDLYGTWLSALTPLKRADSSVVAVTEASMSADILAEASRRNLQKMTLGTGGLMLFLVAAFGFFNWLLLASVKKLKNGASRVSSGDFDVNVAIKSLDEIQDLGDAFNTMTGEIKNYIIQLERLSKANARFVPDQFIRQLGRTSIIDVGLGDQVLVDMSVLFSDIRSFTSLSEAMGPAGTMDMLNDYLSRLGPAIRDSGGFIDKYVGDAIMALFPRSPDDAVDAITAMMEQLDHFRQEMIDIGAVPIESGFGLHIGPLMLGIIGEEQRFEGTVIADVVNLASRLESLTKFYGVRALLSGSVKQRLVNLKRPIRFLDLVRVKGRQEPVKIYELIGTGDPHRSLKLSSAAEYVRGFEEFRAGNIDSATVIFQEILGGFPSDTPSKIMCNRCIQLKQEGLPEGWKGITEFHEK